MALFGDYAQSGYVSQFVARPTDLLAAQSDQLQAKYDMAKLGTMKMRQLASSVQAIKEQKPLLEGELSKYEQAIGELAEHGDWENLGTEVEALAMDLDQNMKQGRLARLSNNFQNYQQYTKAKQELEKEGKYAAWNDDYTQYMNQNIDPTTGKYNFEQTGDISAYNFGGLGGAQDHQKRASEMMKDIAKDGYLNDHVSLDADGNIIGQKGGSEHVISKKVRDVAETKADSFLATQEGKDFAKMVQYNSGRNMDATELHQMATEYLYNSATNQIFQKSTSGSDFSYAPKYVNDRNKLDNDIKNASTSTLEGQNNTQLDLDSAIDNLKVDKNGNPIISKYTGQSFDTSNVRPGSMPGITGSGRKKTNKEYDSEVEESRIMIDNIVDAVNKNYPEAKDWTVQQKIKKFQEARKNSVTVTPRVKNLTVDAMDEQTKLAAKNNNIALMNGRTFRVSGDGLNGKEYRTVQELINGLGLEDKNSYELGVRGISIDDPHGMAGGEVLSVTKGDKVYTIHTSPSTTELAGAYQDTQKLVTAVRSGMPSVEVTHGDVSYTVKNRPIETQDGTKFASSIIVQRENPKTGLWETVRNENNNGVEFSLDEVLQMQHEKRMPLLNAYYHSNFNSSKDDKAEE